VTRPGLIIFDCDGVLVDSELIDARIRSECFRAEGFEVTLEDLRANPGTSPAGLARMIQERFGRPMPEGFMAATRAKIMNAFTDELRAIEGISELLESVTVPICVASNSHPDRVRHSLEVTRLLRFFEPHVYSATMVERAKPAPDLFIFAAERLNTAPADCVVIEDSIHGIMAAQAAGMEVIGFCGGSHCPTGHDERLREAGCKLVFPRMDALGAFLQSAELLR